MRISLEWYNEAKFGIVFNFAEKTHEERKSNELARKKPQPAW